MNGFEIGVTLVVGGVIAGVSYYLASDTMSPYKLSDFNYNIRHMLQYHGFMEIDGKYIKARVRARDRLDKRIEERKIKGLINAMAVRALNGHTSNIILDSEYKYVDTIVTALNRSGLVAWFEESEGNEKFTNVRGKIMIKVPREV